MKKWKRRFVVGGSSLICCHLFPVIGPLELRLQNFLDFFVHDAWRYPFAALG
jgi:hypothetical protein